MIEDTDYENLTSLLPQLSEAIESAFSLKKHSLHQYHIRNAVLALCRDLSINIDEAFNILTSPPPYTERVVSILAKHITIGETYFFRHPEQFEFIKKTWLPSFIERKNRAKEKNIRIWSAGCSTGEEPYSLAILLHEALPNLSSWDITIFATDINENSLAFAKQGYYSEWSFRGVESLIKEKYFITQKSSLTEQVGILPGKRYQVKSHISKMVTFEQFNLVAFPWDSDMLGAENFDLILCRNVLMYFTREKVKAIIGAFYNHLDQDGLFLVSPSEAWFARNTEFNLYPAPNLSIFNKKPLEQPKPHRQTQSIPHISVPKKELVSQKNKLIDLSINASSPTIAVVYNSAENELQKNITSQTILETSKTPKSPEIDLAQTARKLADNGKLTEALALIDSALASDITKAEYHYLKALILMNMNRNSEAEPILKKALFLEPEMVSAYLALASIFQTTGNQDAMRRQYRTALKIVSKMDDAEIVPYSDGMPAKALATMIGKILEKYEEEQV